MGKNKKLIADGITSISKTTFQSFTTQVRHRRGQLVITVPSQIKEHLDLSNDTILEVAIREIPFKYAREQYKIDFFPHTVTCPICGEKGRLSHFGYCSVSVVHKKAGHRGTQKICALSKKDSNRLIKEYEIKHFLILGE